MTDEDITEILSAAADESSPCARVLRFHEDLDVAVRPVDFYQALKADPMVVVRVETEDVVPIDCRFRNGAVEFCTDHLEREVVGRDQFLDDVSDADEIAVIHHSESQFEDAEQVCTDGGIPNANAPHWHLFKQVNEEPNNWTFRHLKEDIACVENDEHRFVIETTLVERDRTHDRYFTIFYEPADVDPLDEDDYVGNRCPFHQSTDESIARNNVGWGRHSIEEGVDPHVVVKEEDDERTVYEVPSPEIADWSADLFTKIKLDTDRDIRALDYAKDEWEERVELEREVAAAEGGDSR